ncbi:MAG: YraN family protein [Alphaproteobacteria bacterium]|nr:YraN family protein [Alphaproteobacteria bacterium]
MRSKTSYSKGLFAEFLARNYLRVHGFRILHNRYITGRNTHRAEIDIIARRGNLIIFVEVKNRPDIQTAWDAITPSQARRLRAAAGTYLSRVRWSDDARFDVIAVCGWRITWFKNAI